MLNQLSHLSTLMPLKVYFFLILIQPLTWIWLLLAWDVFSTVLSFCIFTFKYVSYQQHFFFMILILEQLWVYKKLKRYCRKNYRFLKNIYLFMRDTHTERERRAETQAEGEAGSMQGARRGTWFRVFRITPQASGSANRWATGAAQTFQILRRGWYPFNEHNCHVLQIILFIISE